MANLILNKKIFCYIIDNKWQLHLDVKREKLEKFRGTVSTKPQNVIFTFLNFEIVKLAVCAVNIAICLLFVLLKLHIDDQTIKAFSR